jgi:putative FmdB family regulatory protein
MPTYDYYCSECKHALETFHKISDDPLKKCPQCHKDTLVRRPGGGIGLAFTGDGFYKTMYPKNSGEPAPKDSGQCCPCGKNKGSCNKE